MLIPIEGVLSKDEVRQFRAQLDAAAWEAGAYRPVPTIVEAATMLYRRHGVEEIAAARSAGGGMFAMAEP